MALMTTAEVKSALRLTDSTYDTDIAFFLPYVERDIIAYCNTGFQDGYVYRESGTAFAFVRGDSDTNDYITDEDEEFIEHGFRDGMDIVVEGGWSNVDLYTIDSASTGKLVLSEYGRLIPQDQNDTKDDHWIGQVRVSRVKWPRELKVTAAKMVWHLIKDAQATQDVQSESLDDYSVTYAGMSNSYPKNVLRRLDIYRRVRFR